MMEDHVLSLSVKSHISNLLTLKVNVGSVRNIQKLEKIKEVVKSQNAMQL
jgi:uncharacterized protein Veg